MQHIIAAPFFAALLAFTSLTPAVAAKAKPQPLKAPLAAQGPKWGAHIDLEGKWGNRRSLGDIGLFAPLWQSPTSLFFTDIRGRLDDKDTREGNFGLGLRHMLPNGWNAGIYGYYDARRTGSGNLFQQATLGAELLSADFDLRVNGYLPFGTRERQIGIGGAGGAPFAEFANGTIEIVTPGSGAIVERALRGFDGEIGWRLPVFPVESMTQIRAYAGGFWFDGEGLIRDIAGPRGRIELSFEKTDGPFAGSRFTLGAEVQHDDMRGTNAFAVARLRIPLQQVERPVARLTPQERRMTERVVRDVDIVAGQGNKGLTQETREDAINTYNNETVTDVVQVDAAGGHAALLAAVAGNGVGSVVIANGAFAVAAETPLQTGQTLLGGGAQLPLLGAVTNTQVTFTAPGAAASMNGTPAAGNGVVNLAANSVAGGLTIENSTAFGGNGILALNANGATAFGNSIVTTGAGGGNMGIRGENSADVATIGNTISTVTGAGIFFTNNSINGSASANTILSDGEGITFQAGSNGGSAVGNTIQALAVGSVGLFADGSTGLTIANNTFGPAIGGSVVDAIVGASFAAGSTGNIDNSAALRCGAGDGTATGTVSFTTAPNCVYP